MKKYVFILTAALAAFACSRVMEPEMPDQAGKEDESPVRVIHFRATPGDTRAQFGTPENGAYPTLWTANDSEVKLSLNYASAQAAEVEPSEDFRTASFDATIDFTDVGGPYTFYAVSPAAAAQALSPSREAWKVSIPCEQTPTAASVDEAGIIIAASSIPFLEAPGTTDAVDLHFDHLTAYGRLSFSNLNLNGGTVQSVELTATTPFVGDWYWKCTSGHALIDYGASSTLTIQTHLTEGIWFACAPVDMSEQMMEVTVTTDRGSYYRIIEFPANRKFESGRSAVFTIDMADAEFTSSSSTGNAFTLVTDASELKAGDEVLIVYKAGSKAMGAVSSNSNYREPVDITISTDGTTIASAGSATVLTLVQASNGTWAFRDGSNYLASASSGNNLKTSSSVTDYARWAVSISGNEATIQAQAGASTYLRYNSNSNALRFSCYNSADSQKAVSIYRRGGASASADPMLERSEYGCYLGTGLEWILAPGTDQVTRAYDANGVQTYTLIDPDEVEELEITGYTRSKTKGSAVTVNVHWRKGYATLHSASYSMTVVKEEGPKVWLGDGSGKGFIIKK